MESTATTTRLIECVPNFSNGRDRDVIDAIASAIDGVDGATLLDIDSGLAANRTVMTFVGTPEAVGEAAFWATAAAAERIDMRQHEGVHPRQGATDVCPFVPMQGVSMDECVQLARLLGARVGAELGIPVYLYEHAALQGNRRALARVRAGGYEALADKLSRPEWVPDCGPAALNPRAGAVAVGARDLLVAYNVNLGTRDGAVAKRIARAVRERSINAPGHAASAQGLAGCRAIGWVIDEYDCAQVSMNLTDYRVTGLHTAFDRVKQLALGQGVEVTGSEIVGLVPLDALRDAGRHYMRQAIGTDAGADDPELIQVAIDNLGLSGGWRRDSRAKVLERRVEMALSPTVERAH